MSNDTELSPEVSDLIKVLEGMIMAVKPKIPTQACKDIGNMLHSMETSAQSTKTRHIAGKFLPYFRT